MFKFSFFQLSGLPPKLKAACIHSNMSQKQRETAIEKVGKPSNFNQVKIKISSVKMSGRPCDD